MNVSDVMTKVLVTVRSDAYLQEAAALMVQHCVSGLPVVDDTGTLVGLITEGDLIRRAELGTAGARSDWLSMFLNPGSAAQEYARTHGRKVGEIVAREVITTYPNAPLSEIVDIMESQQVKRLPVLQNQRLVGIVSRADLLRALAQLLPEREVPGISDTELHKCLLGEIGKQRWAPRTNIDATVENGRIRLCPRSPVRFAIALLG